jgi:hypothetical protein
MKIAHCDICKEVVTEEPEHLFSAMWGGFAIDIKVGIQKIQNGEICPTCIKKALKVIAENGIFMGRRITIPENLEPPVPAVVEKKSWSIR